jgi:DNA-binding beta-propeller fold protein YncE
VVAAKGLIFVTGITSPGSLYQIDPTQPMGVVTTLTNSLGSGPAGISFDGERIWTANTGGSVSIVTLNPLSVSTVSAGFFIPTGILYDGANMWITDQQFGGKLFKLNSSGAIIQTVTVGANQAGSFPVFDGTNIWVPNGGLNSVTVVRAGTGAVVATLTGNGLTSPMTAAFDGERILITNQNASSVSLWKAADLTPLGSVSAGTDSLPFGACSDGLNFWITLAGTNHHSSARLWKPVVRSEHLQMRDVNQQSASTQIESGQKE